MSPANVLRSGLLSGLLLSLLPAALSCRQDPGSGERRPSPVAGTADPVPPSPSDGGSAPDDSGAARSIGILSTYDFEVKPPASLPLHSGLREVSGIAITSDGRLLAHNDERGTVYEVDRVTGRMLRQFAVGERRLREDFEDIALAADSIWLVNSSGELFSFVEGADRENVSFTRYSTGLSAKNDVEGLCYDPATDALLLACKARPGVDSAGVRAVYAFDLPTRTLLPDPRYLIDLGELRRRFGAKEFRPAGIARHPDTGHFLLISAVGNSIVELAPEGRVLAFADLPKKYHEQPEGIAIDSAGTLLIASEGARRGRIAVIPPGASDVRR